jgi:transcriptional regulator with XRE-family HTH domain
MDTVKAISYAIIPASVRSLTKTRNKMDTVKAISYYLNLHGMSHIEFSRLTLLCPATVSLIMNRHRKPSLDTMIRISEALNVKLSEFVAAGE